MTSFARPLLILAIALPTLACGGVTSPFAPARTAKAPKAKKKATGMVEVVTAAAVSVSIDGTPIAYDASTGSYRRGRLAPGEHTLEVFNVVGKLVGSDTFTVTANKNTKYRYRSGGRLESFGTLDVDEPEPVAAPVGASPVTYAAPVAAAPAYGSVEIDGIGSDARVWLDGSELPYNDWVGGFTATWQAAGAHDLRVEQGGMVVYSGAVEVSADQNHRCLYGYSGLDCHYTVPALQ